MKDLKFNIATAKEVEHNVAIANWQEALVYKDDTVHFKGEVRKIANPSPRGHKVLYHLNTKNSNKRLLNSHGRKFTVIMLSTPYNGDSEQYKPYRLGLTVLGMLNSNNEFVIKQINHREHGFKTNSGIQ